MTKADKTSQPPAENTKPPKRPKGTKLQQYRRLTSQAKNDKAKNDREGQANT